jgi:Flp pilus assembly protein TadD
MSSVARRYFERGKQALDTGDLETAQESLRAAIDLAPAFGNARVAYAVALARAGDCPRAASVLRAGIPRATSRISAAAMYATLGDVLCLGGDFFGAEEAFNQAAQTPGFEARVASGLARVYAKLGRHADMAAQLRKAATAAK